MPTPSKLTLLNQLHSLRHTGFAEMLEQHAKDRGFPTPFFFAIASRETSAVGPAARATDIKYGPGGMLDVYFAVRYLQLRDGLPDREDSRSTRASLLRLRDAGSVSAEDFDALREGYALLRELDHDLRLLAGRSTRLPAAPDHPLLADLARRAGYTSAAALTADLAARMSAVRAAYDRITEGQ